MNGGSQSSTLGSHPTGQPQRAGKTTIAIMRTTTATSRPEPGQDRLIVVEDDPVTRSMIAGYFATEGFDVETARTCADCRALLRHRKADLLFIDIQLPDGNGMELARDIRAVSPVGIIFVTQRDNEVDRVVGLELAADDYVTKPVNLRELLARSRALLRRRRLDRAISKRHTTVTFGPWILDLTRRELASSGGAVIHLTRGEFDLLAAIVEAKGRPLGRDYLIEVVSNRNQDVDARTVDFLITRIRQKLAPAGGNTPVIATVRGVGYKLGVTVDEFV